MSSFFQNPLAFVPFPPMSKTRFPSCLLLLAAVVVSAAVGGAAFLFPGPVAAAEMRIAVVNMNRALNVSEAGKRSRSLLLASKNQKENELREKENALKAFQEEIKNNILLTDAARAEKEKELKRRSDTLRADVQNAQRDLQERERQLTENMFNELKTVIALIAQEEKFDLVLEIAVARMVLFSKQNFTDITDKVILRFNKPS